MPHLRMYDKDVMKLREIQKRRREESAARILDVGAHMSSHSILQFFDFAIFDSEIASILHSIVQYSISISCPSRVVRWRNPVPRCSSAKLRAEGRYDIRSSRTGRYAPRGLTALLRTPNAAPPRAPMLPPMAAPMAASF